MMIDPRDFAREFAVRAHRGQLYGDQPYVVHLDAVAAHAGMSASMLPDITLDERARCRETRMTIGYLHDVIEDTDVTHRMLALMFGRYIASAIALISDPKGRNRRERKRLLYEQLRAARDQSHYRDAVAVKVSDRLANTVSCIQTANHSLLAMYRKEYPLFKKQLYIAGVCDELWELLDQRQEQT